MTRLCSLPVWLCLGLALGSGHRATAQDPPVAVSSAPGAEVSGEPDPVATLASIGESIRTVETRVEEVSAALGSANAAERGALEEELKSLLQRREVLLSDFASVATGLDPGEYDRAPHGQFVLREEIDELLRPIIDELKTLTAKPREIEQLRTDLRLWEGRLEMADGALARLDRLPPVDDGDLAEALAKTRSTWEERRQLADNRVRALAFQLDEAEDAQPSFYESMRRVVRGFFRTRGLNLLFAILAFAGTFLALRFIHQRLQSHLPWMRGATRPFYARLIDVLLALFSVGGAAAASLFVIYAAGDWVLMGLAIIVLIGLALAARTGLPRFYEDARLLLNLGEVREGERVVLEGIPWQIHTLSFFSLLKNERLRGGTLRLPVRRLAGMLSRPIAEGELWFPTEEGDWVDLPNRGKARVVSQTPEWVQLVQLGGARLAMKTADFLASAPLNLSQGFRLSTRFGIDYRHLAEATTRIPGVFHAHLSRGIVSLLDDHRQLRSLKVEFAAASSSSLDYAIIADFDGSLASRYEFLARALQHLAVDCCNENGWGIPFPQITVHRASDASA